MVFDTSSIKKINPSYSQLPAPAQRLTDKREIRSSKDLILVSLYFFVLVLIVSSAFYSKDIVKNIEKKQSNIVHLEKTYQNILVETEKINVLIEELKSNHRGNNKLIKVIGDFHFSKEAAEIKKQYLKSQAKNESNAIWYYVIIGMFLIGCSRLLYLEFVDRRKKFLRL